MFLKSNKIKIIILTIFLSIASFLIVIIGGRKYTLIIDLKSGINDINKINIKLDHGNDVVECIDKKIENGKLILKFKAVNYGKELISINMGDEDNFYETLYVHKFGLITYNNFLAVLQMIGLFQYQFLYYSYLLL